MTVPGSSDSSRRVSPRLRLIASDLDQRLVVPRGRVGDLGQLGVGTGPLGHERSHRRTGYLYGVLLSTRLAAAVSSVVVCARGGSEPDRVTWPARRPSLPAPHAKVDWMRGASPRRHAGEVRPVGVIKVGPPQPRTCSCSRPGRPPAAPTSSRSRSGSWPSAGLAGVVGRAAREPARGPVGARTRQAADKATRPSSCSTTTSATSTDSSVTSHFQLIPTLEREFAKQWGMNVAVGDLHRVIAAAHRLGGNVVLGGHSLGGSVVTAYATWNFNGHAGAATWPGSCTSTAAASPAGQPRRPPAPRCTTLDAAGTSPWLTFGGIPAPFAGLFNATGAAGGPARPRSPRRSVSRPGCCAPSDLSPPVPVTNLGQFGYALNVGTSPASLIAAQAHLGQRRHAEPDGLHGWDGAGALTPIKRFATMFSGIGHRQRRRDRVVLPAAAHRRHAARSITASPTRRSACSTCTRRWVADLPKRC